MTNSGKGGERQRITRRAAPSPAAATRGVASSGDGGSKARVSPKGRAMPRLEAHLAGCLRRPYHPPRHPASSAAAGASGLPPQCPRSSSSKRSARCGRRQGPAGHPPRPRRPPASAAAAPAGVRRRGDWPRRPCLPASLECRRHGGAGSGTDGERGEVLGVGRGARGAAEHWHLDILDIIGLLKPPQPPPHLQPPLPPATPLSPGTGTGEDAHHKGRTDPLAPSDECSELCRYRGHAVEGRVM